jgi:cytidine deaminase
MTAISDITREARAAQQRAHAPYSGFRVGCALLADDGRVFVGCNVENASYSVTMCAERVALGAAITAGARQFRRAVIVTDGTNPVTPCGACRQALAEFTPDLEVLCVAEGGEQSWRLDVLLPARFELLGTRDPDGRND